MLPLRLLLTIILITPLRHDAAMHFISDVMARFVIFTPIIFMLLIFTRFILITASPP